MYPNYDDLEHSMTEDESNFRIKLLENAGLISVREASFGAQYIYTYHNRFYFNERPNYTYVDTIGHSWQTNATPKNSTG